MAHRVFSLVLLQGRAQLVQPLEGLRAGRQGEIEAQTTKPCNALAAETVAQRRAT
jgi:hypothetical protein